MITLDSAVGSHELLALFPPGSADVGNLGFADAVFEGKGKGSDTVLVACERKTIPDFVQSCLNARLTGHQLPKMFENSDVQYLILEGLYRREPNSGLLLIKNNPGWERAGYGKQTIEYSRIEQTIFSLQEFTPLKVIRTIDKRDTVDSLLSLFKWWSQDYDSHSSHLGIYFGNDKCLYERMALTTKIATQLPGIGWKKALLIGKAWSFRTLSKLMLSDKCDVKWTDIPGIGTVTQKQIIKFLRFEFEQHQRNLK
jgi:ERCC4-type nuclease